MATRAACLPSRPLLGLLVASIGALASLSAHANAGDPRRPVVISAIHGDVQVSSRGSAVKPLVGMTVNLPAVVRTGADGSVELRQGETVVSAAPNAALEIPVSVDPAETLDRIIQSRGNVYYSVAKRTSSKLHVESRFLVAVIKGTQFNFSVTEEASTLSLLEGLIELRSPDGSDVTQIATGQVGMRSAEQPRIRVLGLTSGEVIRSGAPASVARVSASGGSGSASSAGANAGTDGGSGATLAASSASGATQGRSGDVPDLSLVANASAGGSAGSGLMVSNVASGNASSAALGSSNDTVGALQALTARTSSTNAVAGSANAVAGNTNAVAGSTNAVAGSANAGTGSANAGTGSASSGSSGSSATNNLVQGLQNLANSGAANAPTGGTGKSKVP